MHRLGFLSCSFEALIFNQFGEDLTPAGLAVRAKFIPGEVHVGHDMAVLAGNAAAFDLLFAAILYKFHTGRR